MSYHQGIVCLYTFPIDFCLFTSLKRKINVAMHFLHKWWALSWITC